MTTKPDGQAIRAMVESMVPIGSRWRHYKGGEYFVIAVACREDDPNRVDIIYRSHERDYVWSRDAALWQTPMDVVDASGPKTVARFVRMAIA